MTTQMKGTLFDSLEKEFSPTIDSSLIAAFLVELELDGDGKPVKPTQEQIDSLRTTLSELSLQAEESQQSELSDFHQVEDTISSWTTPEETGDLFGTGSGSSIASSQSFSSPLGFLRAALPEVSTAKLRKALQDAGKDDIDIWDIVAGILTEEYIQEMEERGLDGLDDEDNLPLESDDRETVEMRKKKTQPKNHKKKAQPRPQKIALADIRQQHHVLPKKNGLNTKDPPVSTDPWTQLSSLSEYVSSLIPRHPASYFQSFFHSPKYSTSYEALRAALTSLCKFTDEDHHVEVLYNLLDVIMPEYEDSDIVQRNRLISDVQLAVQVTDGSGYEALDLVNVLRDLDSNAELGIYHLQPKADSFAQSLPAKKIRLSPSGPPPVEPPPPKVRPQKSPVQSTPKNKPSPFQWQAVPERKLPPRGPHPLAHHIPAYTRDVNGTKTARAAGTRVAGGPGSSEFRRQMAETMRKRNEALKEASRMWQRGNSKTRGGEIAFYFAERAREFQELARQEALNAARVMVQERRTNSLNHDTIDLHGTTVAEAIVIVKEILKEESFSISQAKPLKIITGKGSHSLNQVSVLKPAIRKALVEDGWVVGTWDGGLIVNRRRT